MSKKVIVLCVCLWLSGCAILGIEAGSAKEFNDAAVFTKEKRYNEAAGVYKKILSESPGAQQAANALYELALISLSQDNPQRDYAQAIRFFEDCVKLHPDNKKASEAQSWISLLKMVQDLKKENEHLNKNIEQLERLDIRHEERRKTR